MKVIYADGVFEELANLSFYIARDVALLLS